MARGVITEDGFERMKESLRIDQALALKNVASHNCPVLRIRFEDLIERSFAAVTEIVRFLDFENDEDRFSEMLKVIRPRSAQCYGGLLELELMAEMEAKEEQEAKQQADETFDPLLCTCNFPPYIVPCSYCESHSKGGSK